MSNNNLTPAELKVRKLARLPSNCICPNCGLEKKFGFTTICIKYFTFVCNECKSSHQAISHRCKSLTMSSWEMNEVHMLEQKGNDYARRTWLKHAPPCGTGGRPQPGMDINVYKNFVLNVYERRKYYGEEDDGFNGSSGSSAAREEETSTTTTMSQRQRLPAASGSASSLMKTHKPSPIPVAEADFLDFGSASFAHSSPSAAVPASAPTSDDDAFGSFQSFAANNSPAAVTSSSFAGNHHLDAFATPSSGSTNNKNTPASSASFDAFGNNNNLAPATTAGTNQNGNHLFDAFGSSSTLSQNPSSSTTPSTTTFGDFDVFAGSSTGATSTAQQVEPMKTKTPVMGNNSGSAISGMGFFTNNHHHNSSQQQQQPQQKPPMMASSYHPNSSNMMTMNLMMGNMNMMNNSNNNISMGTMQNGFSPMQQQQSTMMMNGNGMHNPTTMAMDYNTNTNPLYHQYPPPVGGGAMMMPSSTTMGGVMGGGGGGAGGPSMTIMNSTSIMSRPNNNNNNNNRNYPQNGSTATDKFADLCKF